MKGAIVLVRNREMKSAEDLFGEYLRNSSLAAAFAKSGAAAMLLESSRPRGLLYRHPVAFSPNVFPVPSALVSREDFARLSRLAGSPAGAETRVRLLLGSRTGGKYASRNVVAEWKGREKANEVVLLGAHLDSWELGTGANDDGINVALAIDVLRGMKELGVRPRRSLRVVLFNAEEQGMWGSAGYVKTHAAEMDRHAAVVIFDTGSGRLSGFYLNGRPELKGPVDAALAAASGLGPFEHSLEAIDGTDNFDFLISGVPNLVGMQDWGPYLPDYHAESDTFDKIDAREAKAATAVASVLAWGLAESPEPPAKRQSRAEVDALIKATKLDEQMRPFGQWDDWASGRRGTSR
jgi:Iap family predicted aminopeptidase